MPSSGQKVGGLPCVAVARGRAFNKNLARLGPTQMYAN
jgi:hypothetical protein